MKQTKTIILDKEVARKFKEKCREEGRSMSWVIERLISQWLKGNK